MARLAAVQSIVVMLGKVDGSEFYKNSAMHVSRRVWVAARLTG